MMCYRDRTFCQFYDDCKDGNRCVRALTPTIRERAEAFGLYISQYVDRPECFKTNERPTREW